MFHKFCTLGGTHFLDLGHPVTMRYLTFLKVGSCSLAYRISDSLLALSWIVSKDCEQFGSIHLQAQHYFHLVCMHGIAYQEDMYFPDT